MSTREIAKDLGIDVAEVLAVLAAFGEYVQSPASKLEEPVVRRLYEGLNRQYEPEEPKSPPSWDRKGRSGQGSIAAAPSRKLGEAERSNWHTRKKGDWWETNSDVAPAWELESWKLFMFTEAERDAWIAHGLRPGQVKDAVRFRDSGLMPADLLRDVKGWTVLKRLRSGESPADVIRLLRSPGEDERAG